MYNTRMATTFNSRNAVNIPNNLASDKETRRKEIKNAEDTKSMRELLLRDNARLRQAERNKVVNVVARRKQIGIEKTKDKLVLLARDDLLSATKVVKKKYQEVKHHIKRYNEYRQVRYEAEHVLNEMLKRAAVKSFSFNTLPSSTNSKQQVSLTGFRTAQRNPSSKVYGL